jgi:CubicO group peptidase (beta-lactamase class C family)
MKLLSSAMLLVTVSARLAAQQPDTIGRIDSVFASLKPDGPGCVVAAKREGTPALIRSYGLASLEYGIPNSATTIFHAASIAKQFTAAAILTLASQGRLSLDDTVRKFIPELPRYRWPITIRHLMHHTSGLRDAWEVLWLAGGRDDDPIDEDDALAVITRQRDLNFIPGAEHLYSNTNYFLLGLIVRRASGETLKDYAAKTLFGPAGMSHTSFRDTHFEVLRNAATGYRILIGGRWGHSPYVADTYGDGGLFTTPEDLVRWYEYLFAGQGTPPATDMLRRGRLTTGDSVPYAAGLELGVTRGNRFAAHGGNANGANAYAMRFLDRGVSIAVTCNGRELDAFTFARQVGALFVPSVTSTTTAAASPAAPPTVVQLSAAQLEKFAGIYFNPLNLATRRVVIRNGRLVWDRSNTALDAVSTNRFVFPGQPAELLFPPARADGEQEMQLISGGVTLYRRAAPFAMPNGGLAEYAGKFVSDEVGVELSLTPKDSVMVMSTPGSWSFRLEPIFSDAFALPDVVVLRFTRDTRGRVDGMIVDMGRSRGMRFQRKQP